MANRFMARAIELALEHSAGGDNGPFGAVIVKDGEIVGEGWNRVVETNDPSAHAEVAAIRAACANLATHALEGCTIYASCEPCPMCLSAILWARIEKVCFACSKDDAASAGFDDDAILQDVRKPWEERSIEFEQIDRDAGMVVMDKWRDNPGKVMY